MKRYWVGADGCWFDGANWSEGVVPAPDDTAIFWHSARIFDVSPNVRLWPHIVVDGSWTMLTLICSENNFDEALLSEKVAVEANNLFRFSGAASSRNRQVYEIYGKRGPYEPLMRCAIERGNRMEGHEVFLHESLDTFLLRIGRCRAEAISVDWGDGTVKSFPYRIDWKWSDAPRPILSHKYDKAGRYVVRATAHNDEYNSETGTGENGEPLRRLFSAADVFVQEVFCGIPLPAVEPESPAIDEFTVTQSGENPLQATAIWRTNADIVVIDWGDGKTGQYFAEKMADHAYRRGGRYFVRLTAASKTGTISETRMIEISVTACGTATLYSRFDRMVVVKTSLGKGEMA